ncbi:MAG: DNA polymerase III subunit gamma/tau [Phascolarctobacterium sp.]|nr:DNA polymerase III subunit gamma/tau [Phascolarctobacterium sp.]
MAYVALYRQWRPQNFETLVGQRPVKQALTNALNSGRIAHAYLFAGPRGTGKTSTARILAKALNCEHGPTPNPCGECENCRRIADSTSLDVYEIDAASNRGIDEIKALREQIAYAPVDCRYKVYIIDEVHMLTTEAFNALLKTLEEPPSHVIFILATTDPHKIPPTIHSRCQRFDFRRVTVDEIVEHLAKVAEGSGLVADEEALRLLAIQSEGGMRDALSLLDQCGVMSREITAATVHAVLGIVGREALRELALAIGKQEVTVALQQLERIIEQGKDVRQLLTELVEYLRAVLLFKAAPQYGEIYLTDTQEALEEVAALYTNERLLASQERLHAALLELRGTMRPRITAELCIIELCRREGNALAELSARLEELEKRVASGNFAAMPAQAVQSVVQRQAQPVVRQSQVAKTVPQVQPAHVAVEQTQPKKVERPLYDGPEEQFIDPDEGVPSADELAELSSTPPVVQKQTQMRAQVAPARQPQPQEQMAPVRQPQAVMQQPQVAQQVAQPSVDASLEEFGGDHAAGEELWQQTLELVKSEKKMSMFSCARGGRVYSFANDVLVISFKVAFQSDRMKKSDFKDYFEATLLRLARKPIRLQCEAESELAKRTGSKGGAGSMQPVASMQPAQTAQNVSNGAQKSAEALDISQLPETLQKAHNALGGTITKVD